MGPDYIAALKKALEAVPFRRERPAVPPAVCSASRVVTLGAEDRERRVLLGRQQGGTGLGQVGHRLDGDEAGSRLRPGPDLEGKGVVGVLEAEGAGGLQQLPQGADMAYFRHALPYFLQYIQYCR